MARREWKTEEKLAIVLELIKKERPASQVCKEYGVSETLAYRWRDEGLEGMTEALTGKRGRRDRSGQAEIDRLLKLVGQQAYAIECQKKIAQELLP